MSSAAQSESQHISAFVSDFPIISWYLHTVKMVLFNKRKLLVYDQIGKLFSRFWFSLYEVFDTKIKTIWHGRGWGGAAEVAWWIKLGMQMWELEFESPEPI